MLDPVPWFIGNPGAQHSAEVARLLAYAATGGNVGVGSATDARVLPLAVPGAGVRVTPGAVVIPFGNQQSFIARVVSTETVPIAATGSSGGRTDLICAIIRDPSVPGGGAAPADPVNGPYWSLEVVSGVPSGTTRLQDVSGHANTVGYALARVTLPANTGTVTASHVRSLRQIAVARKDRSLQLDYVSSPVVVNSTTYKRLLTPSFSVEVPAWATHAIIRCDTTVAHDGNKAHGSWAIRLEPPAGESGDLGVGNWDTGDDDDNVKYMPVLVGQEIVVPENAKGQTCQVHVSLRRNGGTGSLRTLTNQPVYLDVEFTERP